MNAIILAAGMSSRFAPLSYEKPKGLLVVRGEVLIERQIRQLQEAGISDITIVIGYMKEQFFYLEEKFGINIVINEDYCRYNNTSSLIRVIDKIDDTFICSSDNYFTQNVFLEKPNSAYYSAMYCKDSTTEYCIKTDEKDRITNVTIGGNDAWYMIGHVYFDHKFSHSFRTILKNSYENPRWRVALWEDLYIENIDILNLQIKRYPEGSIYEFDSLDDLRQFDPLYINNTDSSILRNICKVLKCEQSDIQDIHAIKQGLTNTSFYFYCAKDGVQYVYRHPGVGTSNFINRDGEFFAIQHAKRLGLDNTFVYMDSKEGWKISLYIKDCQSLDYHNDTQVDKALSMIRNLHQANIQSEYNFDLWKKINNYVQQIQYYGRNNFNDFQELYNNAEELYNIAGIESSPKCLCHCDYYDLNLLVSNDNKMYLIDWEYAGNEDPGFDLGTFICCSDYTEEETEQILRRYLQYEPNVLEKRHFYTYISICAYHWFLWALYQNSTGNDVGEYLLMWYKMTKRYYNKAIRMY